MPYLLDTNTVSFILKGNARVRQHLVGVPMEQVTLSVVTEAELRFGLARRPEATRLSAVCAVGLVPGRDGRAGVPS